MLDNISVYAAYKQIVEQQYKGSIELVKITGNIIPSLKDAILQVWPQYKDRVVDYCMKRIDYSISIAAIDGNRVVGFYILNTLNIIDYINEWNKDNPDDVYRLKEDLSKYKSLKGIHGVALGIIPEVRSLGLGTDLKDYVLTLDADYTWGCQLKELNNLPQWQRRRRLVAENEDDYLTLQDITS